MVRAGILSHDEHQLRLAKVVQLDGAFAEPQYVRQSSAAGFVAHVRAVGQAVRAELPDEDLASEGGLVGGLAGCVEDGLVRRGQSLQLARYEGERLVPGDR